MAITRKIMDRIKEYTEDELIYKKYYEMRDDDAKRLAYMNEIEEYVREHGLFIKEFPFVEIPEVFSEDNFYPDLAINNESSVDVVRHSRYTPIFRYRCAYFEILYVFSGKCGHELGDKHYTLGKGDVAFIPPQTMRTIEVFDDSLVFTVHIRRDAFEDAFLNTLRYDNVLSDFFMSSLYSRESARSMLFPTGDDKEVRDSILEMYLEVQRGDMYSSRLLNNMVPIFFARLLRNHSDKVLVQDEHLKEGLQSEMRSARLRILSFIIDNYKKVTLNEVAEHFNYSLAHCSRLIKEETGESFSSFVRNIRLQHAESLLVNTNTTIADISSIIGYENPESFIRLFEKIYNMSPSKYRKKHNCIEE
ncbi:AraC family transcriptional regulator [Butyrivibrio sp. LC3010]|uniref:AraC family transcriptional regulator n=1 Tax=Butyrivibrio sp. LC3010 TaxID=1280680 RepID=UPI000421282A|nr:AraC family transcriptional regulator [Butyrivibrio sp. LC3010]